MPSARAAKRAARAATEAAVKKINRSVITPKQREIIDSPYKKTPISIVKFATTRQNQLKRWRRAGTPFLVGQTPVYLPSFTVSLLRTPKLPPNLAEFAVPLNFNKFDLRDYLWHVYQVRTFAIRSFIKQAPIQVSEPGSRRAILKKQIRYRPQSTKRMIVELEKPFVWPEELTKKELNEGWDAERWQAMRSERDEGAFKKDLRKKTREMHEAAESKLRAAQKTRKEHKKKVPKVKKSATSLGSKGAVPNKGGTITLPMR